MGDSPLIIVILFIGAAYLFKLWRDDMLAWKGGQPNKKGLPGATSAPPIILWLGAIGALVLVLIETGGEIALGVSAEQTDITVIFLLAMIGAGVLEEVLFRGYLIVENKGQNILIISALGFSFLFALAHYQYYTEIPENGSLTDLAFVIDAKSLWSLLLLLLNSLWFYWVRFTKLNPHSSLLPCFVAHIASNVGVFVVKFVQGHVNGLY